MKEVRRENYGPWMVVNKGKKGTRNKAVAPKAAGSSKGKNKFSVL